MDLACGILNRSNIGRLSTNCCYCTILVRGGVIGLGAVATVGDAVTCLVSFLFLVVERRDEDIGSSHDFSWVNAALIFIQSYYSYLELQLLFGTTALIRSYYFYPEL